MAQAQGAVEKLMVFPGFYRNILTWEHYQGGCPVVNLATEADDTHPLLLEKVNKAIAKWKRLLIRLIENGQASGEIKPGADPEKYATLIIALVEGGVLLAKATGNTSYLKHTAQLVEDLVLLELKN